MNEYFTKTSLLVKNQLPRFIRDNEEYKNYVLFLEAYYEWMERSGNPIYESKNILNYIDIDRTTDEFIDYFMNTYMPGFPKNVLVDKRKLLRFSKELYSNKGIPSSFKFMFRVLYDEDVELYNHSDFILRSSSGKWVQTKFLNINTLDPKWRRTVGYKIYGSTSGGVATIESVIINPEYISLNITNILREFTSGELITVVDSSLSPVDFGGSVLKEYIISSISKINVYSDYAGTLYNVGDPVVIVGGLNEEIDSRRNATAVVGQVSSAQLTKITVTNRGNGFIPDFTELEITNPTEIVVDSETGSGAHVVVDRYDQTNPRYIDILANDIIEPYADVFMNADDYGFRDDLVTKADTVMLEAFSKLSTTTYGIDSVKIVNPGTNYYPDSTKIIAKSYFPTTNGKRKLISELGILGDIKIVDGGVGYSIDDEVVLVGGSGYGAKAKIQSIKENGEITSIVYVESDDTFNIGGIGYWNSVPEVYINSDTGAGFVGYVDGVLGNNFSAYPSSSQFGQIISVDLVDVGFGYESEPEVYFNVIDVLVVGFDDEVVEGDYIYQGDVDELTFSAKIYSKEIYKTTNNNENYIYKLRLYDYYGSLDYNKEIYTMIGDAPHKYYSISNTTEGIYKNGIKVYGSGTARGYTTFTKGILKNRGFFTNHDGFLSSSSVLLQGENINQYTYRIITKQYLTKYKYGILSLLHPAGTSIFPVKYDSYSFDFDTEYSSYTTKQYLIDDFVVSGNVITVIDSSNIDVGDFLEIKNGGRSIYLSDVLGVSGVNVTLKDHFSDVVRDCLEVNVKEQSDRVEILYVSDYYKIFTGYDSDDWAEIVAVGDILVINNEEYIIKNIDLSNNCVVIDEVISSGHQGLVSLKYQNSNNKLYHIKNV